MSNRAACLLTVLIGGSWSGCCVCLFVYTRRQKKNGKLQEVVNKRRMRSFIRHAVTGGGDGGEETTAKNY